MTLCLKNIYVLFSQRHLVPFRNYNINGKSLNGYFIPAFAVGMLRFCAKPFDSPYGSLSLKDSLCLIASDNLSLRPLSPYIRQRAHMIIVGMSYEHIVKFAVSQIPPCVLNHLLSAVCHTAVNHRCFFATGNKYGLSAVACRNSVNSLREIKSVISFKISKKSIV